MQGVVSVDERGRIVTANRALEMMFGWATGELIGQPLERLVPSSLRETHVRDQAGYFAKPRPRPMGNALKVFGERKDGSIFPIEVSLNHIATSRGGRAIAFVTDITERQQTAAALEQRRTELEYRTAQLRRMASDLTLAEQHAREELAKTLHDGLQQMLVIAAINLEQHLTQEPGQLATQSHPLVRAKHQIDEAITTARSLSVELFPPVLHIAGLPAAFNWLARWVRDKYGIEVQVSVDPLADSARKDVRTLLFESVRELIFNAVKHSRADRVVLSVAVDADDMLAIAVVDRGVGFDTEQVAAREKAGQTGWGLFSIRERVMLLGGDFDVHSQVGQGTRIRLRAPKAGPKDGISLADPARHSEQTSARVFRSSAEQTLTILLVDDHPGVRAALRDVLHARSELQVVGEASNGIEAVASAQALRPDVIVMDVAMPLLDGIEATRRIHAELPSIQILGLSMQPNIDGPHAIEHAGATGFFTKASDTRRLVAHLLSLHGARCEARLAGGHCQESDQTAPARRGDGESE
jgi:PAS domain S-box-containing protein